MKPHKNASMARFKTRTSAIAVSCLGLAHLTPALAEPWQNLTQPLGVLQQNPPQTANQVNALLMAQDPNITWATVPFDTATDVTRITTSQPLYFVRFYNPQAGSNAAGSWIMRNGSVRGLTRDQVRRLFALPAQPTHMTLVEVPAGMTMYTGIAGPIAGWGEGGGQQSKLISPPYVPLSNFMNQQELGDCVLCYRALATEGNAYQVGRALDNAIPAPYSSLETVYNQLDILYTPSTASTFRQALNSVSGEGLTGSQTVVLGQSGQFMQALHHQFMQWPDRTQAISMQHDETNFWASVSGNHFELDSRNPTAALSGSGAQVQTGLSRWISPTTRVGIALGAGNTRYSVDTLSTTGKVSTAQIGLQGQTTWNKTYLSGMLTYGHNKTRTERYVNINSLHSQQKAEFSTDVVSVHLESGYRQAIGSAMMTPFIALQPAWFRQAAFTERTTLTNMPGAGLGLDVQKKHGYSLPLLLGVQLDHTQALNGGWTLDTFARVAWVHEFRPQRSINAALSLLPDQPFTIDGTPSPRNAMNLTLGFRAYDAGKLSVSLQGNANLAQGSRAWQGIANASIPF